MFTHRVLTAFCKRSPAFFLLRGNLEKAMLGQCAKFGMTQKSPLMFMPINFSNFSTIEKASQISDAPKEKEEEVTDKKVVEANEKTQTKKRKKREAGTKTEETSKSKKKGIVKRTSHNTATANLYKTVLNRVIDTCVIYMEASPEERSKISTESRFYYVKEIIDALDQDEQASFLEYLVNKDNHFQYETFNHQRRYLRKDGQRKNNIQDLNVETHEKSSEEKEHTYTYRNMTKSKYVIHAYLQEPINGPRLHEIILKFLDKENPDFKWYTNYHEDEKTIGKIVQKDPIRGQKQDTRSVIKANVELANKRFRALDRRMNK